MKVINTTREKLIIAMMGYNAYAIEHNEECNPIDSTLECAEEQADEIIRRLEL
tara:strand:+ start:115 stop:273 length:159 start_codon:yes stop_codon:yes gene_type:complete